METQVTAKDYIGRSLDGLDEFIEDKDILNFYKALVETIAVEFAKLKATEALKEASEKWQLIQPSKEEIKTQLLEGKTIAITVDKQSILDAYNLDNIK